MLERTEYFQVLFGSVWNGIWVKLGPVHVVGSKIKFHWCHECRVEGHILNGWQLHCVTGLLLIDEWINLLIIDLWVVWLPHYWLMSGLAGHHADTWCDRWMDVLIGLYHTDIWPDWWMGWQSSDHTDIWPDWWIGWLSSDHTDIWHDWWMGWLSSDHADIWHDWWINF